ncbi:flagellar biosynthesis protein FlhF [Paenibacillus sp. JX-17]|uniref:Flagellar biosynthesis protein FlhF n=1 Tax=Paenibacillus lacisoli TaxID=3064525 RepID=A0ABT9CAA9_9BACL|nr:flagellar biosynthesis protein FlhF [Paenibacillus sp. JX-17]MDO7905815.1 flagellar biosynthesis protein FlhF [Paenibacillus sp. JX-17]
MRVKRYIVETMPEAMHQIRGDLGKDAVILSTKEMKVGGFMGLFRKRRIEVIAAVEKENIEPASQPRTKLVLPTDINNEAVKMPEPAADRPSLPQMPRKAAPEAYRRTQDLLSGKAPDQPAEPEQLIPFQEEKVPAAKMDGSMERYREAAAASGPILQSQESANDSHLLNEIREMKAMMARMSRQAVQEPALPESLQRVLDRLLDQEVSPGLAAHWIDGAQERIAETGNEVKDSMWKDALREQVLEFLSGRMGSGISRDTRVVYVAGPTGVGKTTTIAKLAAEQMFSNRRKVGFITSDTYRISAVEQLRTYASILNVPLEVVQSPGDLQRAMQRLADCDLILMDTAGRNYRNELLVSELQSLLAPVEKSETFLVLSLTSKARDMKTITEHFSKYGLTQVIFTKMDETGSCGALFNLLEEYPLAVSYMTNGQNVPDDLLIPDAQLLADWLLGDSA